jgi:ubiquinone/menaquinone biosynthesis C-methylase UbiE
MEKHQHNSNEMGYFSGKKEYLDSPERREILSPEELLKMLHMKSTDNILDLGAGTGYLAISAAKMVNGLVYALDMNPEMLEVIESRAQKDGITNIKTVKGSIDNIPLPDNSVDIVLASLVLHEVKPLSNTLQQIKRVLREGGYFLCFDFEKKKSPGKGPPMKIRIPSLTMERELISAGFKITQKTFPKDYMYIFIARK